MDRSSRLMWYLGVFFAVSIPISSFAQLGPGGIESTDGTSNLVLWLRADSISGLSNGDPVTVWNDLSGYNHHASQGIVASQPTFISSALNSLPAVQFDGADDFFDDVHNYDGRTVFIVYNFLESLQSNQDLGQLWGSYTNGIHVAIDSRATNLNGFSFDGATLGEFRGKYAFNGAAYSGLVYEDNATPVTRNQYDLVTVEFESNRTLARQVIGGLLPSFPIGTHNYGGQILEIIVYDRVLTAPERVAVENYISSKYNQTITNDVYSFENNHPYDITGVGQSNAESKTSATSSILNIASGAGLNNDGEFLFFGHDNGDLTWSTSETPDGGSNIQRIAREWRMDESGELGNVTLTLDTTLLDARASGYTKFVLLVDGNGDFTEGSTVYELNSTGANNLFEVTVDIADGDYVSIGAVRPVLGFATNPLNEFEGTDPSISIALNYIIHPSQPDVTVSYETQDTGGATGAVGPLDPASAIEDYEIIGSTIATISAGSQSTNFTLNVNQDTQLEGDESLNIVLSGVSAGVNLDVATLPFTINDDDNPRKIYFAAATSSVAETETSLDVTVSLTPAFVDFSNPTTVDYAVTGGTATGSGTDFTLASGTLTIPAGFVSQNLSIALQDDALKETDETIIISLASPTNSGLSGTDPIVHTVTIVDNEADPSVQFNLASSSGDEASSPGITVILSEIAGTDITVDYVLSGTAVGGGEDYNLASGTFTVPGGSLSADLALAIVDDSEPESDETIIITISNPVNAVLGSQLTHTYTISDNDGSYGFSGPGGVGDGGVNALWLRADDLHALADGDAVSQWSDSSGNLNHAIQTTPANQPTYETSEINGRPVIRFDGTNDLLDNNVSYDARTIFSVFRANTGLFPDEAFGQIWGSYNEATHIAIDTRGSNDQGFSFDGISPGSNARYALNGAVYSGLVDNDNASPWTYDVSTLIAAEYSNTRSLTNYTLGSTFPGHAVGSFQYGGDMAEIIVFDVALNTVRRRIVENYLAAKYGLTITNDLYAFESTHGSHVSGLGSEADGNHNNAQSAGILRISNPNSLEVGDYLFFGHDNAALTWSSSEVPADSLQRIAREWRVNKTNDVGTVTVSIDTTVLLPKPADFEDYVLLVDNDGDFSNGGTTTYPLAQAGAEYVANGVTLTNGDYMTIATKGVSVFFTVSSSSGSENTALVNVEVSLSRPSVSNDIDISFVVDGASTASGGSIDYAISASPFTITSGNTTGNIVLTITDDGLIEGDETIVVNLVSATNASIGGGNSFTYTIQDEDAAALSGTGPGGVLDSASFGFWLRADRGVVNGGGTTAVDTDNVDVWQDQSNNSNDGVEETDFAPTFIFNLPEFGNNGTDNVNGKPVIKFDGGNTEALTIEDDALVNTGGGNFTAKTVSIAFQTGADVTTRQVLWDQGSTGNGAIMYLEGGNVYVGIWSGSQGWDGDYRVSGTVTANSTYVLTLEFDGANTQISGFLNAANQGSTATGSGILNTHGGDNGIGAQIQGGQYGAENDSDNGDHYFTGKMMEMITINQVLNTAQRLIMENYLTAKYGILVGGNRRYDYRNTHSYDIAGIGRSGATEANLAARTSNLLKISNASSLDIGDYLMIGHDNDGVASYVATNIPNGNVERLAREWRVTETNEVGTVKFTFDPSATAASPSAAFTEMALLVDADGDFTSGAAVVPLTQNGSVYEADIEVANGDYLTIAAIRPVVDFVLVAANGDEDAGTIAVEATLNIPLASSATVDFALNGGSSSATEGAGNDFTLADGTMTFAAGETTQSFTIELLTDALVESDETVVIDLSSPSVGLNLGSVTTYTFTINDINNPQEIDFAVATSIAEEDAVNHNITLKLNAVNATQNTLVDFAVTGGTAAGGGIDFTLASGTATINSGDLTTAISVSISEDLFNELDETIVITLSNPVNANLGTNTSHTLTIVDNDSDPTISFASADSRGSEANTSVAIPIALSNAAGVSISVDYAVTGGSATINDDYTLAAGTLTFTPGSTSETVSMVVVNDADLEVDETVIVTLSNPSNATLGAITSFTYTIADNDPEGTNGPGGVLDSTDYVFWLKIDQAVFTDSLALTEASDGTIIQRWNDLSGRDYHGIGVSGSEPIYGNNLGDNINGRPVANFSGGDYAFTMTDRALINTTNYTEKMIAVAFQTGANVTDLQTVYEQGGGSNGISIMIENGLVYFGVWSESTGWNYTSVSGAVSSGQSYIAILEFSSADGEIRGWLNGTSLGVGGGITDELNAHIGDVGIGGTVNDTDFQGTNYGGNGEYFTGKIMEVLSLNGVLKATDRRILENYLGARFLAGLGSFDYFAYESTHSHGVSGIGRISATDFKTSTQIGKLISISNASDLDDGEFMIMGHDNGSVNDYVTTEAPGNLERLSREWRVGVEGSPGTISLTFDPSTLASAVPSFGFNNYTVLVDNDGDFTNGAVAYPLTKNGLVYEIDELPLSEGDYFTIGVFSPQVAFTLANSNQGEEVSNADVEISLNYPLNVNLTVTVSQTGGTATEGVDYTFTDGTLSIPAGTTTTNTSISVLEDFQVEADETVVLSLSSPSVGTIGANSSHTFSINDNDNFRKANFALADSTNTEDESPIEIGVFLNARDLANTTEVYYSVSNGTALGDSVDYYLVSDTLTYVPGDTLETFAINIVDDGLDENDETLLVTLTGGSNTTLGDTLVFTYTIQDNDVAPTVEFGTPVLSGSESFQTIDLPISLSAASGKDISVNYAVTGGTATGGGVDFSLSGSSLTIPAGETESFLRFTVIDDGTEEGVESVVFTLSGPTNATLGGNTGLTYNILDNDGLGPLGPGGVGNLTSQVAMWLRATDAPGNSDGGTVSTWEDQSNNNNDGFQTTPANQPTYLENSWNGRAVLSFDGVNDVIDVADTEDINIGGPYDRKTILVAFRTSTDVTTRQMIYEEGGGVRGLSIYIDNGDLYIGGWNLNDDDGGQTTPWPAPGPPTNYTNFITRPVAGNSNNFLMLQFDFDVEGIAFNGDVRASLNGEDLLDIAGAGRLFNHPDNIAIGAVAGGTVFHDRVGRSGYNYTGNVAEVIVNNVVYNESQRRIVNNYLAAKYNVIIPNDYFDHQVNHSYEVIGIGQLSLSDFHNESQGSGLVLLNNPSDLQDNEFLFIGHSGEAATSWVTTEVPNNETSNFIRLEREWRADETGGDVGTVSLFLDATQLPAPPFGFPINYVLLEDSDGDFTSGAIVHQMTNAGGSTYQVDDIDLSGDKYFTIGMARQTVQFTNATANGSETVASQPIEVSLNYIPTADLTVDYAVTGGTATGSGTDYTLADGTLTLSAGSQTANIDLQLVNDTDLESDETVIITLSNPSTGLIGDIDVHTFTINDDDNPRQVEFTNSVGSGPESVALIPVELTLSSIDAANGTEVDYTVTSGSAIEGTDYVLANGTATIAANSSTTTFDVTITDDAIDELDETIVVTLSNPTNANLGTKTTWTYTIQDNDVAPTVEFAGPSDIKVEAISSVEIPVSLATVSAQDVTVSYSLDGATNATNGGIDFDLQVFEVTIPAGDLSANITFTVFNDDILESDEIVVLNLTGATNATVGAVTQFTYTISDDDRGFGIVGPGGVGGNPEMAFFLQGELNAFQDAGTIPATNGDLVLQWNDIFGEGSVATPSALVSNSEPTYRNGASAQAVNGQAVLEFDGVNDVMTVPNTARVNTNASGFTLKSLLIAFETGADVTSRQMVYEQGGGGNGYNIWIESGVLHFGAWSSFSYIESTTAVTANTAYYVVHELDQPSGVLRSFVNGAKTETGGMSAIMNAHGGNVGIGAMNNGTRISTSQSFSGENFFFGGKIMEVVHYNDRNLNDAQHTIIASYMQAKYGITVTGNLYTFGGAFGNEVIGIGADGVTGERHVAAQGTGILNLSVPTNLDNGDFMFIGNDDGAIDSWVTANAPNNPFVERVARTWKVNKINDLGNVRIGFDSTRLPAKNAGFENYYLLIDNDADGDFTDAADGAYTFIRLDERFGSQVRVSNQALSDGDVFTIVMAQNVAIADGDFDDPAVWLIEAPQPGDPVVIGSGSDVTLTEDVDLSSVTINGGTLNLSTFRLTLTEGSMSISGGGALIPSTGTVEYGNTSGSSVVCVEAATYYNLLISGSGTKELCGNILITNDLQINGDPTLDANGFNIEVRGNWNSAVSANFSAQADLVTFSGTAAQQISKTGNGTESFNNVIINKGANDVTIAEGNVQVDGILTMTAGDLILGTHNLVINNPAAGSIAGGSATSYIKNDGTGFVQQRVNLGNTYNLPVGDVDDYAPLVFTLNTGSLGTASIRVTQTDAAHPARDDASILLTRYWTINPVSISGSINYNLSFVYPETDVVGDEAEFKMAKFSGGAWTNSDGTESLDVGTNTLTWNGITSFSDYTAFGDGTPLPVTWANFRADLMDDEVALQWSTASEHNNDFFTIERSADGQLWESLGTVDGAGNSISLQLYYWLDENPIPGQSYYRIRQTDFDGAFDFTAVKTVVYNPRDLTILAYPNPVEMGNDLNLVIEGAMGLEEAYIKVVDLMGRVQMIEKANIGHRGNAHVTLKLPESTPAGAYIVVVEMGQLQYREQIILR